MKFSEKKTQALIALYEKKFDGKFYDISELLEKWDISISISEAIQIGNALENEGLIKLAASSDGAAALITGEGVEFVEEYDFFKDNDDHSTGRNEGEIIFILKKLDELFEQLSKLELGKQITYDDLRNEIDELKDLLNVLNKKNWFQLLQGKLVTIGLGKLTDQVFEIVGSTFGNNQLKS